MRNDAGPKVAGHEVGPIIGGSAGDDAVVIGGEFLGFFAPLLAAGGAAVPVRPRWGFAVKSLGDRFALERHFVDGAISKIGQLFGMTEGKGRIATVVAGVGGCGRVVVEHREHERLIHDRAGPSAIPDAHEFAIPRFNREPDLYLDFRVRRGTERSCDAAESWKAPEELLLWRWRVRLGEFAGGHKDGARDGRVGEGKSCERVAGCGG